MYVYKTTNLINGLIYIGISKKDSNRSKNYLGSGNLIKKAIKDFGRGAFTEVFQECHFHLAALARG